MTAMSGDLSEWRQLGATVENKQFTREDRALRARKMRIPTYPKATMPLK